MASQAVAFGARRLLLCVLAWLGLPLCAQSGAGAAGSAAPAVAPPLGADAIRDVLRRLDVCFERGDAKGYLALFEPDHPGAHALLEQQLQLVFSAGAVLRRTSTLASEPRRIGSRTVVRVRHEIRGSLPAAHAGGADPKARDYRVVEDVLLALRGNAGEAAVPTFVVEIPSEVACVQGDRFRCPPCNYEFGGAQGWLCVPMRGDRSQAIEAASFYLVGTDLACDVSVRIDGKQPPAMVLAEGLAEALRRLDPTARPGIATAWCPPAHAADAPKGLAGARIEIVLPEDFPGRGGGRAVFHVATLGALQHLVLVRGSARSLEEHAGRVQALLGTYRMLETDCDLALAAARPLQHHTDGALSGGTYRSDRHGLELDGPAGWTGSVHCGGAAFRVAWTSPRGSRLWLVGHGVPPGLHRWCRESAERWFQQLCEAAGLEPGDDAAWHDVADCGESTRLYRCTVKRSAEGRQIPAPRQRLVRLVVRDDLLVVLDGYAMADEDVAPLHAALEGLRRRR